MNAELARSLVDGIYAAASRPDEAGWQDVVDELSEALGGAAIALVLCLPGYETPARSFLAHLRPMPSRVLMQAYQSGLPFVADATRMVQTGFMPTDELFSFEDASRNRFCAEWMEPQGLLPLDGLCHCFAYEDRKPMALIAIFRRRESRAFGPDDLALCDLLAPHLACGYQLHRRIHAEQHERIARAEVMDRLPIGMVLLDRDLHPVVTNRTADRIFALDDGMLLGPDGLRAANPRDDAVMREILSEIVEGKRSAADGECVMAVSRPSGKRSFPLLIGMLDDAAVGDTAEDAIISLIFGDPETGQGISPEALRSAYDLTPAESELVGMLAEGHSLAEAAKNRGVSVNTVRTQLKHVFAKTDTNRQGELIRFVLTGSASFPRSGY